MPRRDYAQPSEPPGARVQPEAPIDESLRHAYRPPSARPQPSTHVQPAVRQTAPHHQSDQALHRPRPKKRRWLKFIAILVILAALAAAGWWGYPKLTAKNPFPTNAQTDAANSGVALFYPQKLPTGYQVDRTNFQTSNGVIIFSASNNGPRIIFTVQKTAPSFDYEDFYNRQLQSSQRLNTIYGQAVVGKSQDHYLGSLVSNGTWLILSANSGDVTSDDMVLVMQNLKKY